MLTLIKFIFTSIIMGSVVCVLSIIWPRFTTTPRPQVLESVYQTVMKNPTGVKTANVLGVTSSIPVQPINLQSTLSTVTSTIVKSAEERVEYIIARQAVLQLMNQYDKLNPQEKQIIQDAVCKPVPTPSPK